MTDWYSLSGTRYKAVLAEAVLVIDAVQHIDYPNTLYRAQVYTDNGITFAGYWNTLEQAKVAAELYNQILIIGGPRK